MFCGEAFKRRLTSYAGVVDQDIEGAVCRCDGLVYAADTRCCGDVGCDRAAAISDRSGDALCALGISGDDADFGASAN
jgi:hypothetical protein